MNTTPLPPNIAKTLQPGGIVPIDIPTTSALVAEIKRQQQARADLEAENKRLRAALESARGSLAGTISKVRENPNLAESTCRHGMHGIDAALVVRELQ